MILIAGGIQKWGGSPLIWFWGSPWVLCIRVWEDQHTCGGHDVYTNVQVYTSRCICKYKRIRMYTRLCVYIRGNTRARTRGIAPPLTSLRSFLPTFYCQIWPLLNHMCASLYIVYVCNINTNKHTSVLFAKSSSFSAIYTRLHVWCREAFIAAIKEMCERDRDTMGRISSIILR